MSGPPSHYKWHIKSRRSPVTGLLQYLRAGGLAVWICTGSLYSIMEVLESWKADLLRDWKGFDLLSSPSLRLEADAWSVVE